MGTPVEVEFDFSPSAAETAGGPDVAAAREGTALCLSGGGWRAALFHLGGLTRLNELGILAEVDTVSAVSGGSILAGFLQGRIGDGWPNPGDAWRRAIVGPFCERAGRDLRGDAFRARANPFGPEATDILAATLDQELGLGGRTLDELPTNVDFIFGAADIRSGRYWIFSRARVGYADTGAAVAPSGPSPLISVTPCVAAQRTIAVAVAASSCFPPVFPPMTFKAWHGEQEVVGLLVDGGLVDNTGVEAVIKHAARVYVSDGGGAFDAGWSGSGVGGLLRYAQVSDHRGRILSRRWLTERFRRGVPAGLSWSIREGEWADAQVPQVAVDEEAVLTYSGRVAACIGRIRTDLDSFSDAEIAILVNHGYLTCVRTLAASSFVADNSVPVTLPFPRFGPGQTSDAKLLRLLCMSASRQLLGHGKRRVPVLDDIVFGRAPDCDQPPAS